MFARTVGKRDTKEEEKTFKIKYLYQVFGISKQAYYKRIKTANSKKEDNIKILQIVNRIRKLHPRCGTRKLMEYIRPELEAQQLKIGRDALFTLLRNNDLLVRKTKRFHITTDSKHFFYKSPNILKDIALSHAEQAVVCDITYIKTDQGHGYLSLVTDPYSKKIMGYALEDNMKVEMVKKALKMAYENFQFTHPEKVIHHSDRGIQYCCPDYADLAEKLGFRLSTTQQYDPYENAIAERINGILKYEYGLNRILPDIKTAQKMIAQAVEIYNTKRIHWSLDLQTPNETHRQYHKTKYKSYSKTPRAA